MRDMLFETREKISSFSNNKVGHDIPKGFAYLLLQITSLKFQNTGLTFQITIPTFQMTSDRIFFAFRFTKKKANWKIRKTWGS